MAWRGVHLSQGAHLSSENRSLKISFRDPEMQPVRLPFEDLSYLILDSSEVTLTSALLSDLSVAGVLILGVDAKHLPSWASFPWTAFYKQGPVLELQINVSGPLKKRLWAHIVRAKIKAQANTLRRLGFKGTQDLEAMARHIRSGDPGNIEARGAKAYWQFLFPNQNFVRHRDDFPNALLNYGYALYRAALARQLCVKGFVPQLGIHHMSQSNAYNLADDLIEPLRPMVDELAVKLFLEAGKDELEFSTDHRRALAQLLSMKVFVSREQYEILGAIENMVDSFRKVLDQQIPPEAFEIPIPVD